jgi:tryptophan-rich sensory protein
VNKYLRLILFILICEASGLIGSIFTVSSIPTWYATLAKPFFNPPSWVFGPVWTTLYFLMGVSIFLVWGKKKADTKWFWIQLFFNFIWSIVFFGFRNLGLGFIIIALLWASIVITILEFKKINKISAYLLLPYLAWVSFASLLNFTILLLNR